MALVSFIIPLYNSEKTLERTILSIQRQTLKDIEIVMADDGSTDATRELAAKIASDDDRILFISRTDNRGVSFTRNEALRLAKGKYIRFVDADDTIPKHSTEEMVRIAEEQDSGLVIGIMKRKSIFGSHDFRATVSLARKKDIPLDDPALAESFSLCNKLFRRDIITENKIQFDNYRHAEDGLFLFRYMAHISRISGCNENVYTYYKPEFFEDSSSTSRLDIHYLNDILNIGSKLREMTSVRSSRLARAVDIRIANNTLINEYYGSIWDFDDETEKLLLKSLYEYKERIGDDDWADIAATHSALNIGSHIPSTDEIAASPYLTVAVSDSVQPEDLAPMLESLYSQKFPSFSVVIHESLREYVPSHLIGKKNMSFVREDNIFNYVIESSDSECLAFMDHGVVLPFDTYLNSIKMMSEGVDFISGITAVLKDGEMSYPPAADYAFASYSIGDKAVPCVNGLLDSYLANKVFRRAGIERENFRFSGDGREDIKRIFSSLTCRRYRKIKYILPQTHADFLETAPLPESTYEKLRLLSISYQNEKRALSEVKPLADNIRSQGFRDAVLFIPSGHELGSNARALYDALDYKKEIIDVSKIKSIGKRMKIYSVYSVVVFESFDFRYQRQNITPGQTVIPLAGELCRSENAVKDALEFIADSAGKNKMNFLRRRKALREWLKEASTEKADS